MLRMRAWMLPLLCALVLSIPGASPSLGQTAGTASPEATCAGPAVYWAGSGPEVHITRRGTINQRSALDPQAEARTATVLEVTIRGKPAAAYGPSFEEMRRAGPSQELEQEFGAAIQWEAGLATLPHEILLIADDGADVVARLRFVKCLPPPKARAPRERPARSRPAEAPAPAKPPAVVPQGAIQ